MNNAVELLQALIGNACVNDGNPESGHEHRSVATLETFFGMAGEVFEPHPGRQSVLYRLAGSDPSAPTLMLMGHLDVVPVSADGWTHEPFGGEIHDGFVWGRGAVDMLNLTAAMASVFRDRLTGPQPRGDILFLAVADEENGGTYGAEYLVAQHWDQVAADYMITEIAYPAVAGKDGPVPTVNVAEKGPFWHVLHASGTPGHASQPYGADNALAPVARAVSAIIDADTPVLITHAWEEFVKSLDLSPRIKSGLVDVDRVDAVIDELAETDLNFAKYVHACTHLTMIPTVLNAGGKANVVPDAAAVAVDARLLPGQDEDTVRQHLAKILGGDAEALTVEVKASLPASASVPEGLLWEAVLDGYEQTTGTRLAVPTITPASTDARFWRDRGTISYGCGLFSDEVSFPDFLAMFHGHDERVSVESMHRTVEFLTAVLDSFERRVA